MSSPKLVMHSRGTQVVTFLLIRGVISWRNRKQEMTIMLTMEAEYIVAPAAV